MPVGPIDLQTSSFRLHRGGEVHVERRTAGSGRDGWRLAAFHAKTDADVGADHWEVHPEAETVVSCLIGKMRLYLRPERPGRPEEEIGLTAGTAVVVPRGRWHRIELDTPSSILTMTWPQGGRRERRTGLREGPRSPSPPAAGPETTRTPKAGAR